MGKGTKIEWTHLPGYVPRTHNVLYGCSLASEECNNCYAQSLAYRFSGPGENFEGLAHKVNGKIRWTNKITFREDKLEEPLRWQQPSAVFANSLSDIFHKDVPLDFIKRYFDVMNRADKHIFMVLTKRAERMAELAYNEEIYWTDNIWQGVSAGTQKAADERIPFLLGVPAKIRFVSAEPLLESVKFMPSWLSGYNNCDICEHFDYERGCCGLQNKIDWIIAGAESGVGHRPMNTDWVRSILKQCEKYNTAFFYKQEVDAHGHKITLPELDGKQWAQFPIKED